ncbi:MAG: carboxypeptidase-like regulatory domain-containing protein [Bacteroidia bacterium]
MNLKKYSHNLTFTTLTFILLTFNLLSHSQTPTQTIKGQVTDKQSKEVLVGATVVIIGSETKFASATDLDVNFKISGVPAVRYYLKVNYLVYK